jgi:type IV secretion system protein TrbB
MSSSMRPWEERRLSSLNDCMRNIIPLLEDEHVLEVLLNADGAVWADRAGDGLIRTGVEMAFEEAETMLKLIASIAQLELGPDNPTLATRLPGWGLRVQASLPPIVEAPVFALRKPARLVFSLEDYVAAGILSEHHARCLRDAVRSRANILFGGPTSSGKTTLANAAMSVMSETGDRIYIVEDTPELQCTAPNHVRVVLQPGYTCQRAIADALRFRPDRIVVGEVRDGSALQLIKAWNTGHPGGLATIHADDTPRMLDRVCQLIEEVMPVAPRRFVAEAVNVVVHIRREPRHPAGRVVSAVDGVEGVSADGRWILSPL